MNTGRFPELDDFVSALAARYRAQGPPTLLYVALSMLGYSALLQGKPDLADRFFDEAVGVDVPDRTVSVNKPIEARAAFGGGTGRRPSGSSAPTSTSSSKPTTRIWRRTPPSSSST